MLKSIFDKVFSKKDSDRVIDLMKSFNVGSVSQLVEKIKRLNYAESQTMIIELAVKIEAMTSQYSAMETKLMNVSEMLERAYNDNTKTVYQNARLIKLVETMAVTPQQNWKNQIDDIEAWKNPATFVQSNSVPVPVSEEDIQKAVRASGIVDEIADDIVNQYNEENDKQAAELLKADLGFDKKKSECCSGGECSHNKEEQFFSVDLLGLNNRLLNLIKKSKIQNACDLKMMSDDKIVFIKGIWIKGLREIRSAIRKHLG